MLKADCKQTTNMKEKEEEEKGPKYDFLNVDNTEYKTNLTRTFHLRKPYVPLDKRKIHAFIPGTIRKFYVKEGDKVKIGDKLLILEAMKMKNDLLSPLKGKVKKIYVKLEETVANKQLLIELE